MPFSLASLLSSSNASSSNRTVRAFFERAGTNFICSTGVSSSANSSLEWVSQKAASSSMVLKVGIEIAERASKQFESNQPGETRPVSPG